MILLVHWRLNCALGYDKVDRCLRDLSFDLVSFPTCSSDTFGSSLRSSASKLPDSTAFPSLETTRHRARALISPVGHYQRFGVRFNVAKYIIGEICRSRLQKSHFQEASNSHAMNCCSFYPKQLQQCRFSDFYVNMVKAWSFSWEYSCISLFFRIWWKAHTIVDGGRRVQTMQRASFYQRRYFSNQTSDAQ